MAQNGRKWRHPGGKLREQGADKVEDSELLAVLISSGTKGRSAETIAREILDRVGSLAGLANQAEVIGVRDLASLLALLWPELGVAT